MWCAYSGRTFHGGCSAAFFDDQHVHSLLYFSCSAQDAFVPLPRRSQIWRSRSRIDSQRRQTGHFRLRSQPQPGTNTVASLRLPLPPAPTSLASLPRILPTQVDCTCACSVFSRPSSPECSAEAVHARPPRGVPAALYTSLPPSRAPPPRPCSFSLPSGCPALFIWYLRWRSRSDPWRRRGRIWRRGSLSVRSYPSRLWPFTLASSHLVWAEVRQVSAERGRLRKGARGNHWGT